MRLRAYFVLLGAAATGLALGTPASVTALGVDVNSWVVVATLLAAAAFQVESVRWLDASFGFALRPRPALAAWALAAALLLPPGWLVVVMPLVAAHAFRRGRPAASSLRWLLAAFELTVCGVAAGAAGHAVSVHLPASWQDGGTLAAATLIIGATVFLLAERVLWLAARALRVTGVRWWIRGRRASRAGLVSDVAALLGGVLVAAVWSLGPVVAFIAIAASLVLQHLQLLFPMRSQSVSESRLVAANEELTALVDTLAARNSELDELLRFKTDLMSMLGHEISNPLTSVLGFSQIGLASAAEDDAAAARSALVIVERNARKVADVVSDIRQLVASERGGITAVPEAVHLGPRLRSAIEDRARNRKPDLSCPPEVTVQVQPGHLDQIVANLLSNAAKYGGGATDVTVDEDLDDSTVTVTVADAGPGVSDEARRHLFKRYWRDATTAGQVSGTGIGLYISRELARANGGDLVHEPVVPTGSRFVLTLARTDAHVDEAPAC